MCDDQPLAPLLSALRDLVHWLKASGVRGMVTGGVAASLLGRPRATRDVDVLVLLAEPEWERFLAAGQPHGFVPRIADALAFALDARVLLLVHRASGVDVAVILGALPFEEEAIRRAGEIAVGGLRLPVPTPEDLLVMKAVAGRPRDIADAEGIIDGHPGLDREHVLTWVRAFAEALDAPEMLTRLQAMLDG